MLVILGNDIAAFIIVCPSFCDYCAVNNGVLYLPILALDY
jgi:hypothetical protein